MQIFYRTFIAVYLAHLLTDFVFQTYHQVGGKERGRLSTYLWHGSIHYLSAISILGLFLRGSIASFRTHIVILMLSLVHLLIDWLKITLTKKTLIQNGGLAFLSDQFAHLLTVVFAAWFISPTISTPELIQFIDAARSLENKILMVPIVYIAVVFGGGYLIRFLTKSLTESVKPKKDGKRESKEELQSAGLYIGWLERFLVLTAILLQSPATVGLILTAKSIARYPEFETERFAEYFLIGTLLSISVALIGGVLLAKLLFGQVKMS